MNKPIYKFKNKEIRRIIFYPGDLVLFRIPGVKMLGVVQTQGMQYPKGKDKNGLFQIKIVYVYKCTAESSFSDKHGNVNKKYIGGNFHHHDHSNVVKLTLKDIKALNQLIRDTIMLEAY
jgi:hypothetical protein